jgi:hypothetical protein
MRFGGLQKIEVKGQIVYRSRRVLTPQEATLLGKKELTRRFEAHDDAEAERLCEGHLDEFQTLIEETREEANRPYNRLLKADPSARYLDMEEISDRPLSLVSAMTCLSPTCPRARLRSCSTQTPSCETLNCTRSPPG